MTRMAARVLAALIAAPLVAVQADEGAWFELEVPGGRATLTALGVAPDRDRASVMIEIIRRRHFSPDRPATGETALRELRTAPAGGGGEPLTLPLPLSPQVWSDVVFGRAVPSDRLFAEILNDPRARLLYHGLAGLDPVTRRWLAGQADLLRWLSTNENAVRAFSIFAPAVRIENGRVTVPGGAVAEQRWAAALDADAARPAQFVRRLFDHNAGRTAGLYFTAAGLDVARRRFLLGESDAAPQRFERLVSQFAACYPPNATAYPFILRSHDAALLLSLLPVAGDGTLPRPLSTSFWREVLSGDAGSGPAAGEDHVDAAWLVEALCQAEPADRSAAFVAFLAGNRLFAGTSPADRAEAVTALRSRRSIPAAFMALERAGIQRSTTYASVARAAARLDRLTHPERTITALRQFQAALALVLDAAVAGTFEPTIAARLVESLAAVPFEDERYDGRIVDWLATEWLPAARARLRQDLGTAESVVAAALAGPDQAPRRLQWEGLEYVVDVAGSRRRRFGEIRKRQGGATVDDLLLLRRAALVLQSPNPNREHVAELRAAIAALAPGLAALTVASEYEGEGPEVSQVLAGTVRSLRDVESTGDRAVAAPIRADLGHVVDFVTAHVLASWAYAPHLGEPDNGALAGGDGSLRHRLGVRGEGRGRREDRWEVAVMPATRGTITGSLLGLQAPLAGWSLRRLSSDRVPSPPTIDGNDLISLMLTAALSDPVRLTDGDQAAIRSALIAGTAIVERARPDAAALAATGAVTAMSPWRRETLSWVAAHEPARLIEQFSTIELLRLGGLQLGDAAAWGTVSLVTGCLCLQAPPAQIPELMLGRAADGIVGARSGGLVFRVAAALAELNMPAALTSPVLAYAMRDYLDVVRPVHHADLEEFERGARALSRRRIEDYLGAIAAIGPLRPVPARP